MSAAQQNRTLVLPGSYPRMIGHAGWLFRLPQSKSGLPYRHGIRRGKTAI